MGAVRYSSRKHQDDTNDASAGDESAPAGVALVFRGGSIDSRKLGRLLDQGVVTQLDRGVYARGPGTPHRKLAAMAVRNTAPISLTSALAFYGLCDEPDVVHLGLNSGQRKPRAAWPPVTVSYTQPDRYAEDDVTTHVIEGVSVAVVSPERSLAESLKHAEKVDQRHVVQAIMRGSFDEDRLQQHVDELHVDHVLTTLREAIAVTQVEVPAIASPPPPALPSSSAMDPGGTAPVTPNGDDRRRSTATWSPGRVMHEDPHIPWLDTTSYASLLDAVDVLAKQVRACRDQRPEAVASWHRQSVARLIYESNNIESAGLPEGETAAVIEAAFNQQQNTADHEQTHSYHEVADHFQAFCLVMDRARDPDFRCTPELFLEVHGALLANDDRGYAGKWRTTPVYIPGKDIDFMAPSEVPKAMDRLATRANELLANSQTHPIERAAIISHQYVRVHPHTDGNGRMSRLLLNACLYHHGYPFPAVLKSGRKDKKRYYRAISKADRSGDIRELASLVALGMQHSYEGILMSLQDGDDSTPAE